MTAISAAALAGWSALVRAWAPEVDPERLLRRAGIAPQDEGSPRASVPYAAFAEALALAAAATGRDDLGRALGRQQADRAAEPMHALMHTAPTLADALEGLLRYAPSFGPALDVGLETDDATAHLWFGPSLRTRATLDARWPAGDASGARHAIELVLARTLGLLATATGPQIAPLAVGVPHDPVGPPAAYARDWGRAVEFGGRAAGLWFALPDLDRPLGGDPAAHGIVRSYLDEHLLGVGRSVTASLRDHVEAALASGALELADAAARLGIHERTLQRRLAAEGTSMRVLTDVVRRDVVRRLLGETDLGLAEVAERVGYSDQSALTRACRRWFDATPTQVRRRLTDTDRW